MAGCESNRAQIQVIIDPLPTVSITPNPAETCSGTPLLVSGGAAGGTTPYASHTWTGTGATHLNSQSTASPTLTASVTTDQTYSLTYEVVDARGCKANGTRSVQVYALPTAILTATPSEICSGGSSPISAVVTPSATGGTGTWTGATKNTETTATFSGTSTTTISYSFTNAHGCAMASPATTSVTVHPIPAAPTVADLQYCKDATLVPALSAGGTNLTWYTAAW